jgi:hypothetical protein
VRRDDLREHVLAVTDDDGVEEQCHGLGVVRRGSAADDERVPLPSFGRAKRQTGEVECLADVRVGELVGQCHAEQIDLGKRQTRLEREERYPRLTHGGRHIRPGHEDALDRADAVLTHPLGEDLQGLVGHAHLVGVGVHERHAVVGFGVSEAFHSRSM